MVMAASIIPDVEQRIFETGLDINRRTPDISNQIVSEVSKKGV
jgi:hypothetical protein